MVTPIRYKTPKPARVPLSRRPAAPGDARKKARGSGRSEIHGRPIGSTYEANVADALEALNWQYRYQVPINYGRDRRGGIVLDFLVSTRPLQTPIYVNGRYWHKHREEIDRLQQANLSRLLGYRVAPTLVMWDESCLTFDDAFNFLSSRIGRG